MPFLNDNAFDSGLSWVQSNGSRLDITSSEATTYAEATSTLTLGNKTGITVGAPTNGDVNGRKVVIPAITDGSATGTNTATHWALTNGTNTLIATGTLTPNQVVTSGNTFTLEAINITLQDATSV